MNSRKILIVLGLLSFIFLAGCEHDGTVDISDCKDSVTTSPWASDTWTGDFTCSYDIQGIRECYSRQDALFSNQCVKVIEYVSPTNQNPADNTSFGIWGTFLAIFVVFGLLPKLLEKKNKS